MDKGEALATLRKAAVTYAPSAVPLIASYLDSDDPEIRSEALNAMLILGEASGALELRKAARRVGAEEARGYLEAAAYLELPPHSSD